MVDAAVVVDTGAAGSGSAGADEQAESTTTLNTNMNRINPSPETRTCNALLRSPHCLGERGFALLIGRWHNSDAYDAQ